MGLMIVEECEWFELNDCCSLCLMCWIREGGLYSD